MVKVNSTQNPPWPTLPTERTLPALIIWVLLILGPTRPKRTPEVPKRARLFAILTVLTRHECLPFWLFLTVSGHFGGGSRGYPGVPIVPLDSGGLGTTVCHFDRFDRARLFAILTVFDRFRPFWGGSRGLPVVPIVPLDSGGLEE